MIKMTGEMKDRVDKAFDAMDFEVPFLFHPSAFILHPLRPPAFSDE